MMESHIDRLPPELIISIIDKISDLRWLSVCLLVSKHFAALVLQTRSVSVPIPSIILPSERVPVWPQGSIEFLKKLHCLESATIRFSFGKSKWWTVRQSCPSLVRWKVSESSSFIFLFAKNGDDDSKRVLREFFSTVACHLHDIGLGFSYIKELLVLLPNLKNVLVADSMNQGRIVLEEEEISRVKKVMPSSHNCCIKWWRRSHVKLPFSSCVMKDVILFSVRNVESGHHGFGEENFFAEKELCELAMSLTQEEATDSVFATPFPRSGAHFADTLIHAFVIFMRRVGGF